MGIRYLVPILFALVFIGGIYHIGRLISRRNKIWNGAWPGAINPPQSGEVDGSILSGIIMSLMFLGGGAIGIYSAPHKEDPTYQVVGGCVACLVGLFILYNAMRPRLVRWDNAGLVITTGFNRHSPHAKRLRVPWSDITRIKEHEGYFTIVIGGPQ